MTTEIVAAFDYLQIADLETRVLVQQRTSEIKSLWNERLLTDVEIGRRLIEVKQQLEVGLYRAWIEAEFPWGKSLANEMKNVALRFGDVRNVDNFDKSALRKLASPSVSDDVIEVAIARANSGEQITHAASVALIEAAKPKSAFVPDQTVTVQATRSPYVGQAVTVREVEGDIVVCETPDGAIAPFLPGELATEDSSCERPVAAPKNSIKTSDRTEGLEAMLAVSRQRIEMLEGWMRNAIASGVLPNKLMMQGQELLGDLAA